MKIRFKHLLFAIPLVCLLAAGAYLALPRAIAALPGQYRVRLPQPLLEWASDPLPTALPAPAVPLVQVTITIPFLDTAEPAGDPTPEPSATPTAQDIAASPGEGQAPLPPTWTPLPAASATATLATTATPAATATPTAEPLPPAVHIQGVPIVGQKYNNCGPANLSLNLAFYGHDAPQLEIAAVLKPEYDDRNVSPEELVQYVLDRTSLAATLHRGGDLQTLKRLIAQGFPVVVEKGLTPNEAEGWMGHYLTLVGYDDAAGHFLSIDTLLGPWDGSGRPIPYPDLEHQWGHFNYAFYLVYPAPQAKTIAELLGPDLQDPPAMWRAAALRAQAEIEVDPDNPFAWFNLGASMTRLADLMGQHPLFEAAAVAFDHARQIGLPPRMLWYQFEPYLAYLEAGRIDDVMTLTGVTMAGGGWDVEETHLYRGHALLASGDTSGARAAYRQALEINPNFRLAGEALASLDG